MQQKVQQVITLLLKIEYEKYNMKDPFETVSQLKIKRTQHSVSNKWHAFIYRFLYTLPGTRSSLCFQSPIHTHKHTVVAIPTAPPTAFIHQCCGGKVGGVLPKETQRQYELERGAFWLLDNALPSELLHPKCKDISVIYSCATLCSHIHTLVW